jgi:DUF4097 and DUF4098 domain-containing protein YvlB
MKHFCAAFSILVALAAMATIPASAASDATFERDLNFSGRLDLSVATGSGSIHLTTGPAGHVHIFGRVRQSGFGFSLIPAAPTEEEVRDVAAHPPVQQTGSIVRIGGDHRNLNNISIDYEIQAPPDAYLNAATGSGSVFDEGVGANAKLSTGSGSILANDLQGGFTAQTGSGNISASQTGSGDVKAGTGSGSIELKNVHGGLQAGTGSGNIKIDGTPVAPWRIHTGSGNVELWTAGAGMTLDASTGSGGIHCDRDLVSQGSFDHHHVKGSVAGGGPEVRISTGSGGIRIH